MPVHRVYRLALGGAGALIWANLKSERARRLTEIWRLKVPVVGSALRLLAITRFCRILGTMLANGVPLLRALEKRGDSTQLREGAHHVFHDLSKGALRKYLRPVLDVLEGPQPGDQIPMAALRALELLDQMKRR